MRGFWGRYELCDHEQGDEECDGGAVHFSLLEVEYEHVPSQPAAVRIVRPDIGTVEAIDVRANAEEARKRLADNLRYLTVDLEKQMREAEYAAKRVSDGPVEPLRLDK